MIAYMINVFRYNSMLTSLHELWHCSSASLLTSQRYGRPIEKIDTGSQLTLIDIKQFLHFVQ